MLHSSVSAVILKLFGRACNLFMSLDDFGEQKYCYDPKPNRQVNGKALKTVCLEYAF